MTHKEVITALRSTPTRSKRELFDTAADMIEQMMDKPVVSNADRIRNMTDEELAMFISNEIAHGDCYGCRFDFCYKDVGKFNDGCANAHYKWLQQPADHFREATKKEDA